MSTDVHENIDARIARLERELQEVKEERGKAQTLVIPSSWTPAGSKGLRLEPGFDGLGDLCIVVYGGFPHEYQVTWINRQGARDIIAHLAQALLRSEGAE